MVPPLIVAPLSLPALPPNLVTRPRLFARLDAALERGHRLTALTAPVGAGKTTLVADWLQQARRPAAWLSLDEADNEPTSFLARLGAALRLSPGANERDDLLSKGVPSPETLSAQLARLMHSLATRCDAQVLVMDNLHEITAPAARALLAALMKHQPPQLHLICLSRVQLPMPTARLRAAGLLSELRIDDLAFTADETDQYLRQSHGLALDAGLIAVLQQQTEGWIAGVQLAALALENSADAATSIMSFGGGHRDVVDYFAQEVLEQMPPHLQAFLRQTATLERLSAGVCDAMTGRDDSAVCLRQLEQINQFVIPLDHQRQWYRYHRLFAAFLRATAEQADVSVTQGQEVLIGSEHLPERSDEVLAVAARPLRAEQGALAVGQDVMPTVWRWLFHLLTTMRNEHINGIAFLAMAGALELNESSGAPHMPMQLVVQPLANNELVEPHGDTADAVVRGALVDSDPLHASLTDELISAPTAAVPSRSIGAEDERWAGDEPLSRREREILRLIALGKTNEAIAEQLVIAPGTVKKHLDNIYGKLGVHNRATAVIYAQARELL